jgi:alkylation response protein AidB-like acyl-CoA dehydrogenase
MACDDATMAALKEQIVAFVTGPGEEYAEEIERTGAIPPQLWPDLRSRGYLSLAAPPELGGRGVPFPSYLELMELFSQSHASVRMIVHVCNGIWRAMAGSATPEQAERFVKPAVAGQFRVAFALTERSAGSGADLRTTVTREADTYYLTGEKHLITFGVSCDFWLLFARLAGSQGSAGLVALMVPRDIPGARVTAMPESMGVRGTDHAVLAFDRAPVPVPNRLGPEGAGLEIALRGFLTPSRMSVAMSCVGLARRAQEVAIQYAQQRVTFGKPIITRQAIRFMIAENAADIEAARSLILHAARRWEQGSSDAEALASMAKLTAVEVLTRVTDKALQIHGGSGYWQPNTIERIYRDARAQRFEEGTNEVQKAVIAREILGGRG